MKEIYIIHICGNVYAAIMKVCQRGEREKEIYCICIWKLYIMYNVSGEIWKCLNNKNNIF